MDSAAISYPFYRNGLGDELCLVCGSARSNEFWACAECKDLKPKLDPAWKDGRPTP